MGVKRTDYQDATDGQLMFGLAVNAGLDPDKEYPYVAVIAGPQDEHGCGIRVLTNIVGRDDLVLLYLADGYYHLASSFTIPDQPGT